MYSRNTISAIRLTMPAVLVIWHRLWTSVTVLDEYEACAAAAAATARFVSAALPIRYASTSVEAVHVAYPFMLQWTPGWPASRLESSPTGPPGE